MGAPVRPLSPLERILDDMGHFMLSCLYVLIAILTIYMRFGHKAPSHRIIWQLTFSVALIVGIASTSEACNALNFLLGSSIRFSNRPTLVCSFTFSTCCVLLPSAIQLWVFHLDPQFTKLRIGNFASIPLPLVLHAHPLPLGRNLPRPWTRT
jgi:hypothetical protein